MLRQSESESLIRGERPTRAVPLTVRKSLSALRRATGRGEGTRLAPRGVSTKWSDRDELFRSPTGGVPERRTRPPFTGNAAQRRVVVEIQVGKLGDPWACLPGPESKIATVDDRGNSHDVDIGALQWKTRRYKQCEIRSRRRWRGRLCRVLWRTQHHPVKVRQKIGAQSEPGSDSSPTPRGVTVVKG